MARSWSWLVAVETSALVTFLGLLARLGFEHDDLVMVPLDSKALVMGSTEERWNGIFLQDQHVGYAVTRSSQAKGGGRLFEERAVFTMVAFGQIKKVITAGTALVDAAGTLQKFDFLMNSDDARVIASGEVRGDEVVMSIDQGGEARELRFPLTRPPQTSTSLESALARQTYTVGASFGVPYFDPLTLSEGTMDLRVEDVAVLENGEEAYWLRTRFHDVEARMLVAPNGEILRQESALFSTVRMTEDQATALPNDQDPVDIIALTSVHLDRSLRHPRELVELELDIQGVPPERVRHEPPLQTRVGTHVRVVTPDLGALPALPIADRSEPQWVEATRTLPAGHREIKERAEQVTAGAADRRTAAELLNAYVYQTLVKVSTIGIPDGLEVLRSGRGDCNEHTALYVSLARSLGIPARIAAGVVYSDRISDRGAFYYHAWPEVRLGGPTDWVPIDPTFGQFPADATHVKLVEGDLDQQVEIMAVMGKLRFGLVEQNRVDSPP